MDNSNDLQSSLFEKCSGDQVGTALANAPGNALESARPLVETGGPFLRPPKIESRIVSNGLELLRIDD